MLHCRLHIVAYSLVISLCVVINPCDGSADETLFRVYGNLTFVGGVYSLRSTLSEIQCAIQCASYYSCKGFATNLSGLYCAHMNGSDVSSLTFDTGDGALVKRKILLQDLPFFPVNLDLGPTGRKLTLTSKLTFGDLVHLRAVYLKDRVALVQLQEQMGLENVTYEFKAGDNPGTCSGKCIAINNQLNGVWNNTQYVNYVGYGQFAVNETFDLHILLGSDGIVTYLNGNHLYTMRNDQMSISDVRYIFLAGNLKVVEFSV